MEKKIIIKLFEEFKNDLALSKSRVNEIIEYISANYKHNFKYAEDFKIAEFSIDISINNTEPGEWFKYEIEISSNTESYDEILTMVFSAIDRGGQLEREQDQSSPAEYADNNYDIDINEVHYSKYYTEDVGTDIDYIDLTDDRELQDNYIKIANLFISEAI